jgi:hypothetical protein
MIAGGKQFGSMSFVEDGEIHVAVPVAQIPQRPRATCGVPPACRRMVVSRNHLPAFIGGMAMALEFFAANRKGVAAISSTT